MGLKFKLNALIVVNVLFALCVFFDGSLFYTSIAIINLVFLGWADNKTEEELREKKVRFLMLGCINGILFINFIASILYFILYFNLKKESKIVQKTKEVIDPQVKKIDILLKLGVGMVFIAGFVFATTGWYSLPSIVKLFIFWIVGALFIFLSKFCEKRIRIKSTIYLYWFLGLSFLFLMFVTAGYGALFGNYFSLIGSGSLLYEAFLLLIVAILFFISYFNFHNKKFLYLVYGSISFAIINLCNHFLLSVEEVVVLLVPVCTFIKAIKINKKDDLYTLSIFSDLFLLLLGIIFVIFMFSYTNIIAVIVTSLLLIYNLYCYVYSNKESDFNVAVSFLAYLLVIPSFVLLFENNMFYWEIGTVLIAILFYFVSFLFDNKVLKLSSLVTVDILTILVFIMISTYTAWFPLVITMLSLVVLVVDRLSDNLFEKYVHPVKVSMLIFSVIHLLEYYYDITNVMGYWMSISLLFVVLMYCLSKNKLMVAVYENYSIGMLIVCLMFVPLIPNLLISLTIFICGLLFYADATWAKKVSGKAKIWIFILLMADILIGISAIENAFVAFDANQSPTYLFSNIVSIVLLVFVALFHRDDEVKLNISLFTIIIPIINLIESYVEVEWVDIILPSIFIYYLTFIVTRLFKKDSRIKNIIGYIGYSLAYLLVIFESNYYVLGFSLILIAISLLLGYYDKTYNSLFKVSVVAIILLILYQLKEFWNVIPAWLYLLVFGILLIGFATYKQFKLVEKNDEKKGNK